METAKRKAIGRPSLGTMFHNRLVRGPMLRLIVRQRVNVVSADLPGPTESLYFAGQFNIMAVGDADTYPDIDVFGASARDDLRALVKSTASVRDRSSPT